MTNMVSVAFCYNKCSYNALIRFKETESGKKYYVTIMNGKLEKLLYGNHIFVEVNGCLQIVNNDTSGEVSSLRAIIGEALSDYLKQTYLL